MEAHYCQALKVLGLVHELHKRGYQRLRIAPGMSPSGCAWRCSITPRANVLKSHGASLRDWDGLSAHYSSSQENEYFNWSDAREDTAAELADKFVERFPEIARAGFGDDWPYAGWYVRMLGYAEQGWFPIAYSDWGSGTDTGFLPLLNRDSDLPMPPAGDAAEEDEQ